MTKQPDPKDLYLKRRRSRDEATALRKARASVADLKIWRRDRAFRDLEEAAKVAPRPRARVINPYQVLGDELTTEIPDQFMVDRGIQTDDLGVVGGGWRTDFLNHFKRRNP